MSNIFNNLKLLVLCIMLHLQTIVEQINDRNKKILFKVQDVLTLQPILKKMHPIEFLGHGVQSICFRHMNNVVVKCCLKKKDSIIVTSQLFLNTAKRLLQAKIAILPPINILFENDIWLVYTQPMCQVVSREMITYGMACQILNSVCRMIEVNLRISDIFFRNLGIYLNHLVIFDYHDVDTFETSPSFMISNLYSFFTQLGKNVGWPVQDICIVDFKKVIDDNFGSSRFPDNIVNGLLSLHERNYQRAKDLFILAKNQLYRTLPTRQVCEHLQITDEGIIVLDFYALARYETMVNCIEQHHLSTIIDWQPMVNGVSLLLAKTFPQLQVTLCPTSKEEHNVLQQIVSFCLLTNITINSDSNSDITHKYDLSLYHCFDEKNNICHLIKKYMGKFCLFELPVNSTYCLPFDELRRQLLEITINLNRVIITETSNASYLYFCGGTL